MRDAAFIHFFFMFLAVIFEVAANVFSKYSHGFKRKLPGLASIFCIMAAFGALSQAVKGIELSVAYAFWGGSGILLTIISGQFFFKQRLRPYGWLGVLLMISGMSLLKMS